MSYCRSWVLHFYSTHRKVEKTGDWIAKRWRWTMRSPHGKSAIFSSSLINLAQWAAPTPSQRQAEIKEKNMVMTSAHTQEWDQRSSSSVDCAAHMVSWRRRCRDRWSEREKLRLQSVHLKGLMPVCLRKWRVSSSERANFQEQPSQVHL